MSAPFFKLKRESLDEADLSSNNILILQIWIPDEQFVLNVRRRYSGGVKPIHRFRQ